MKFTEDNYSFLPLFLPVIHHQSSWLSSPPLEIAFSWTQTRNSSFPHCAAIRNSALRREIWWLVGVMQLPRVRNTGNRLLIPRTCSPVWVTRERSEWREWSSIWSYKGELCNCPSPLSRWGGFSTACRLISLLTHLNSAFPVFCSAWTRKCVAIGGRWVRKHASSVG